MMTNTTLLILCVMLAGCVSYVDLSQSDGYRDYSNATYELLRPVFVVWFTDGSGKPGMLHTEEYIRGIEEVSAEHAGKTIDRMYLAGVIPAGTAFTIVDILFEKHPTMGGVRYFVKPTGSFGETWPRLDASYIQTDVTEGQRRSGIVCIDPNVAIKR